jgi:hypothetical protein
MAETALVAADDMWHQPTSNHPHWTETSYWGFYAPNRRLSGIVYNMWRRNLGIVSSRVWIWNDKGDTFVDALYSSMQEHLVIPCDADPTNFSLPNGLSCQRVTPLQCHRLRFTDGDAVHFDLTAQGVRAPVAAFHASGDSGAGHFDQHIHVTGSLELWGESIDIDCVSMRDRTWSVRDDSMGTSIRMIAGYMHAASLDDQGWLVMAVGSPEAPDEQQIPSGTGSLVLDGKAATVVGGTRRVTQRSNGRPTRIEVELHDGLGRTHRVRGKALNHFATMLSPAFLTWFSLYRWVDETGRESYGESQEAWIPLPAFQQLQNSPETP